MPATTNGITVYQYVASACCPPYCADSNGKWVTALSADESFKLQSGSEGSFDHMVNLLCPGIVKLLLWHTPNSSFVLWGVATIPLFMCGLIHTIYGFTLAKKAFKEMEEKQRLAAQVDIGEQKADTVDV